MKPSSPEANSKAKSKTRARNCTVLNLLGTPGLGSLVAGRIVEGIGQLAIAIVGFGLFTVWIIKIFAQFYGQIDGNVEVKPVGWIGLAGCLIFAVAWVWSLMTSLSVNREERDKALAELKQPLPPPKL